VHLFFSHKLSKTQTETHFFQINTQKTGKETANEKLSPKMCSPMQKFVFSFFHTKNAIFLYFIGTAITLTVTFRKQIKHKIQAKFVIFRRKLLHFHCFVFAKKKRSPRKKKHKDIKHMTQRNSQ